MFHDSDMTHDSLPEGACSSNFLLVPEILTVLFLSCFQEMDPMQVCLDNIEKQFKPYNRER